MKSVTSQFNQIEMEIIRQVKGKRIFSLSWMLTRLGQLHSVVKGKHKIKEHVWNAENVSLEIV